MEIDDEDVVVHGTDLQKYLHTVGYSEFEVSESKHVNKRCLSKSCMKTMNNSNKIDRQIENHMKNYNLYVTLIKIIIESHLVFKEDILLIKEFIPSNQHIEYLSFFTKRNRIIFSILFFCGLLNVFFSKYYDKWITICTLILWFGYIVLETLYNLYQNRTIKKTVLKTIKSMEKTSLLVQKITHFILECNNLHGIYSLDIYNYSSKNSNAFKYLLMPELRTLILYMLHDLINFLVYNICEIHKFFPLKDFVSNIVYLYLTDCNFDVKDTSLENINKAKYLYFLLQSEFLKQVALCLCPILWTSNSSLQINHLIETVGKFEKVYLDAHNVLIEEYNQYLLFKNNNIDKNKLISDNSANDSNIDLKSKMYNVRHFLQNMMVHMRFMEDSIENSSESCIDDITSTLNVLIKEINIFNEYVSNLQIFILKSTNNIHKINKTVSTDNHYNEEIDHIVTNTNDPIKCVCEDELFFGISEELGIEPANSKILDEELFDKSNNHELMLELKVALKDKQAEWKHRECKLLEKHPHLNVLSDEIENNEKPQPDEYTNKIRKTTLDFPSTENFPMQLPNTDFANEIAMIACKWNTNIQSFGDDSDSDTSIKSTDS